MKTVEIKLYSFDELSEEAKKNAIEKYYEYEDYSFLEEDLTYELLMLLLEKNIKYENVQIEYRLSYSQGDGVSFTGNFEYKNKKYSIVHKNLRYSHAHTKNIVDVEEDEYIVSGEFYDLYLKICKEIKHYGYSILDYRMDNDEFYNFSEANEYFYTEDGILY